MLLAQGHRGELRAGGRLAARLGPWSVHVEGTYAELEAVVLKRDEFLLTRRPLDAVLDLGGQRWRFRDVEFGDQRIGLGGKPEVLA